MLPYRNQSTQKPPRDYVFVSQDNATSILQRARNNIATVWQGDFHQAKQILAAMKKRLKHTPKAADNPPKAFHQYRLMQSQNSRLTNALLVQINSDYSLDLPRAPNVAAALTDTFGANNNEAFLLPLNQLLGFIGAHEWHKKGVFIPELNASIHVPFGVFSPIRGEYLSLITNAPLSPTVQTAMDIGTGSGVLAALLARRNIAHIIATDNNERAIACAQANIARLGLDNQITVLKQDLFADKCVDLIVCNPPWLPAKPTSMIETALYDPNHAMLHALLRGAAAHLNENGQLWIIMSDLAEHLALRGQNDLNQWFDDNGWKIVQTLHTQAQHAKAHNANDPLSFARQKEKTYLFVLERKNELDSH